MTADPKQTADEWKDLQTPPPATCEIVLLLADGREVIGEYWEPPPVWIDPDRTAGGFAWDGGPGPDFVHAIKWKLPPDPSGAKLIMEIPS
jgi:hypothetical protein